MLDAGWIPRYIQPDVHFWQRKTKIYQTGKPIKMISYWIISCWSTQKCRTVYVIIKFIKLLL